MKHCTTDKCPQILDSSCVFYEGASLIFSGINTNDSVEVVIQKLNLKLESIPIFNSNNYYDKTEIDILFNNVNLSNYYTKNEADALFTQTYNYIDNSIIDYNNTIQVKFLDYYTKVEINSQFLNYYTKTELDTALATKQENLGYTPENITNKSDSYIESSSITYASTKALVDGLDTKLDKGAYTGTAQDLKNEIDGKANISHTHNISDVSNLQTSLNLKEDLSNKVIDFSVVNDVLYPSVKAVDDFVKSQRLEVPFANATSVTINHNLDKLCSVTISLEGGSFALCDYYNIDNNNILVEFSTQQTGKIILI